MTQAETITVAELAKGTPQRAIAAQNGMSQSNVSRINHKHRELIQYEQAKLIDATLSTITDQTIREINITKGLTDTELLEPTKQQALSRIDKKAEMILKSTGIAPSHAPSMHIVNIFNDNSKTLISAQVTDLLGDQLDGIIDVDCEEIEDNE